MVGEFARNLSESVLICGCEQKEVQMVEKKEKRKGERRRRKRRRPLNEEEFRTLIEKGKVYPGDRRIWEERREKERRGKE